MAEPQPATNAGSQPAPAPGDGTAAAQFAIEKIYVKDLSLENPGAPQSFQMTEAPQIEIGLRTRAEQIGPDMYECVLTLTVTARTGDKTVFLVEAAQAGVFAIRGVAPEPAAAGIGGPLPGRAVSRTRAKRSPTRRSAQDFRRCISRRSISKRCISSSLRRRAAEAPAVAN